jgi:hypothetical protein
MLRIFGVPNTTCDGVSRRECLRVGGLSLFNGMTLPRFLRAAEAARPKPDGPAKSVICFNLLGGPSQMDMFDLKPNAPVEIRGEFTSIETSVPGIRICEHLPNIARLMHKAALIRTVTHNYNAHNPLPVVTGYSLGDNGQLRPYPTDPPDIGAICQYLGMGPFDLPGAVCMPCYPGWGESANYPGIRRPGTYGGYLGSQYDPLFSLCEPTYNKKPARPYYDTAIALGEPQMPASDALPAMTADRLDRRRSMLEQLDGEFERVANSKSIDRLDKFQQRAFAMLCSSKTRDAFDLSQEPAAVRNRYGGSLFGNCMIVARRLVEAGVPFISIHAENFSPNGSYTYDMHENNFAMLKEHNLPVLDAIVPALVEDLEQRDLLDSALIYVMGEMGRSPKVNAKAGRDHWPQCAFCLMFGGGIRGGTLFGSTDAIAAYPDSNPVSPGDIVSTIYQQLGIDPHFTVPDRSGRPVAIAHGGEPIWDVIG